MNLFFDTIIFGFLLLDLAVILWLLKKGHPRIPKRAAQWGAFFLTLAWGIIFYGSFIEPRHIVVKWQNVRIREDHQHHLQAVVLSDIHLGPYKDERFVRDIADTIREINPDVIFILGDFVYENPEDVYALAPFSKITYVYPTYAVLGNHDFDLSGAKDNPEFKNAQTIHRVLEQFNIHVLENESIAWKDNLFIAGVKELWTHENDLSTTLTTRNHSQLPTILLAHNPDIVKEISLENDIGLVLAGHTHGGQIRLPLIGPVGKIPDTLGQEYDEGLFEYNGTQLFITSGLGESGPRARLFNPPEVVALTIEY